MVKNMSTAAEFIVKAKLVHQHHGKGYGYSKVIYVGSKTEVEIICPKHGTFWQTPNNHLRGKGCQECAGNSQLTNQKVDARLVARHIKRIGDVKGGHNKILWECLKSNCGFRWMAAPSIILYGAGCKKCANNLPLTNESVDEYLFAKNIKRLRNVDGSHQLGLWKCLVPECSHEWEAKVYSILAGHGCRKCVGLLPLTNAEVDIRLINRDIMRIGDVSGTHKKTLWKCLKDGCGHEWPASPRSILRGGGCPVCKVGGFNPSKPSVVYAYSISDSWVGYGITNNFEQRNKDHQSAFKKAAVTAELIATYECIGTEAQRIETLLKKTFDVVNTGIDGFKREATHLHNLPKVLELIKNNLNF